MPLHCLNGEKVVGEKKHLIFMCLECSLECSKVCVTSTFAYVPIHDVSVALGRFLGKERGPRAVGYPPQIDIELPVEAVKGE